jgi:hypothetical protein
VEIQVYDFFASLKQRWKQAIDQLRRLRLSAAAEEQPVRMLVLPNG